MVSTNNKGHPNPTPTSSGTPSGISYCKYRKFPVSYQVKSGARCPHAKRDVSPLSPNSAKENRPQWPKRTVPNGTNQ